MIVHRSASEKLAVVHSSCLFGAESYSGQRERKSVTGKVSNERFVNSSSVHIYVVVQFYPWF